MAFTSSYTPGLIQQSEYIYGTPDVLLPGNISGTTATFTNVTASGTISASGNITAGNVFLPGNGKISFDNSLNGSDQFISGVDNQIVIDGDDLIVFKADTGGYEFRDTSNAATVHITTAGAIAATGNITASANISASGTVFAEKSLFGAAALPNSTFGSAPGSTSAINIFMDVSQSIGQIITTNATGENVAAGQLVYPRSNGRWYLTDADSTASSIGLLGIALNTVTAGNVIDVLIDGVVTIPSPYITAGNVGNPLYVDTTAGSITNTAPSGENDVVRIVGHYIQNATGFSTITFKPDGTWVEL